jgi:hypothetical protein
LLAPASLAPIDRLAGDPASLIDWTISAARPRAIDRPPDVRGSRRRWRSPFGVARQQDHIGSADCPIALRGAGHVSLLRQALHPGARHGGGFVAESELATAGHFHGVPEQPDAR